MKNLEIEPFPDSENTIRTSETPNIQIEIWQKGLILKKTLFSWSEAENFLFVSKTIMKQIEKGKLLDCTQGEKFEKSSENFTRQ